MGRTEDFPCTVCGTFLKNQRTLRAHERTSHNVSAQSPDISLQKCQEKGCNWTAKLRVELRNHLQTVHGFHFEIVRDLHFDSATEFDAWCYGIENTETPVHLVENQVNKLKGQNEGRIRVVRECSRSGAYEEKDSETRKRRKLERGTTRIGHRCTLQIQYVREIDSTVTVEEACLTHYGHTVMMKYALLSKIDRCLRFVVAAFKQKLIILLSRMAIAAKAQAGVPAERIIRDLNQTVLSNGQVITRKQLITKKDVVNITRSYGIMV